MLQISMPAAAFAFGAVLLMPPPAAAGDVWHAARTLQAGDTLRGDDITPAEPPGVRPRQGLIETERRIVGLEVKRRVPAGQPITERDVGERDLVRAGQPVRVFWKNGGMSLELQGKALEGGALGNTVRVHNPQSGRTFRASVVADGTAEVQGE
ncbi:flagellar basal body P-ring formation chaperone FlgA [Paracraurococcus ruber]|uniref:Flagella basal body P-ring formation protein FlgA n=1 Tax=Paracraurococcus ruber TaxID=77675 RepID=A0ABS1D1E6_9PROT|nr:flagellar basal body P-ring formation chaperone FlgA [Paracraurococcus ruber]MBK1659942.1 flagella basal body P-ring formation protein FlgA [Paracraurococcus ruber]TDG28838.1 flagellar basal body P-ring formation protein FlgA [Paracraurococcus ruber]